MAGILKESSYNIPTFIKKRYLATFSDIHINKLPFENLWIKGDIKKPDTIIISRTLNWSKHMDKLTFRIINPNWAMMKTIILM